MSRILLNSVNFKDLVDLIYQNSGLKFTETNKSVLENRLQRRLIELEGKYNLETYINFLKQNEDEKKLFFDLITTNLTYFFRNATHFEIFENYVIPQLIEYKRKHSQSKTIKIWSAGCSTGEEPYSLAMVLKEILPYDFSFKIIASDLSFQSLVKAKSGLYSAQTIQSIPLKYRKYLDQIDDNFVIKNEIKSLINFDYHNLAHENGHKNIDIIFCRNVLIYFDEDSLKGVVNRFYQSLANQGYLFIGHSESLIGLNTKFQFLKTNWGNVYGKGE